MFVNALLRYCFKNLPRDRRVVYIDVGAMGGLPKKWKNILDVLKVYAFEPDEREYKKLKSNQSISYLNYALSDHSHDLRFHVTKGHGLSSVYKPNLDFLSQFENVQRFQIESEFVILANRVSTLDQICAEQNITDADFIKIDTQGSELIVLKGGDGMLKWVSAIQIEVEFAALYKNQPVFRDVDSFLSDKGFQLIDLKRQYWKYGSHYSFHGKGQLIFGDALYFKRPDAFIQSLKEYEEPKSKLLKAIVCCCVYGIYDYAFLLVETSEKAGLISDAFAKELQFMIQKNGPKTLSLPIAAYNKLHSGAERILRRIRPSSYLGWADSDREIGNIRDA